MLSNFLKRKKNAGSKNSKFAKTKSLMLLSKCAAWDSKKSKCIKQPEASGLLSSLGMKKLLNKITLLGLKFFYQVLFCFRGIKKYKINEIVNKFLLPGDEFIPKMHLRHSGLTYRALGPFTKKKERIQETLVKF